MFMWTAFPEAIRLGFDLLNRRGVRATHKSAMQGIRMSWQDKDKKQPNVINRIFVSETEYCEVDYYVDHYLVTRNYAVSEKHRNIVIAKLKEYPGKAPVKRDDLNTFLDSHFKK
jgi:hypothetical protein